MGETLEGLNACAGNSEVKYIYYPSQNKSNGQKGESEVNREKDRERNEFVWTYIKTREQQTKKRMF